MDSVRLGRVLGLGARHAVKTLVTAVDAATAEKPGAEKPAAARPTPPRAQAQGEVQTARPLQTEKKTAGAKAGQAVVRARELNQGVRRGGKRFGEAVWGPVVKLSGVLWLEFTGVFFGIFAAFAASGVWKARGQWSAPGHGHIWVSAGMAVVFGYFCVSSFVSAARRGRRR